MLAEIHQLAMMQPQNRKLLLTVSRGSSSPIMPSAAAFLALWASNSARVGPANESFGYASLQVLNSRATLHDSVAALR